MVSVDTRNAATMQAALDAGATIVNDVSGLVHDPAAAALLATISFLPEQLAADTATAQLARSLWPAAAVALAIGAVAFTRDGIEFGLGRYRDNTVRTLRGCAVWLIAASVAATTRQLVVLWGLFAFGLGVRAYGAPRGLPHDESVQASRPS